MAKIDITRTELVWPGKYNENGMRREVPRVSLPFQVIERVNESRATREAANATRTLSLFDIYQGERGETFEDGWRNKLIWGDNLLVTGSLLKDFAGKIDFIYIDPPFATGADFGFSTMIGEEGDEISKQQSILEELAYRDTWRDYLSVISSRLELLDSILSPSGAIAVHLDWRLNYKVRCILDECFGSDNFRNDIAWSYRSGGASRKESLPRKHDSILIYAKSSAFKINGMTERQYLSKPFMGSKQDEQGRFYVDTILRDVIEGEIITVNAQGQLQSYNTRPVLNLSTERLGYDTQKPEGLLALLLEIATQPGDLVADFFWGSGTTLAVAEKLGRRWIGCDLGRWAVHVSRKRLLQIDGCKPFEVLNLGKYERQYWQGVTFGHGDAAPAEQALFEYLAFILKLYGAQPLAGLAHLHGKKSSAMVHVGAVDSPVTIDEIQSALDECVNLNRTELHVLGWEWEMGLNDLMTEEARNRGIKLLLLHIPREVMEQEAIDKGEVRFFELSYLEFSVDASGPCTVGVALKDFVIPNTELIPPEVREKVRKWSDFIDYWAVDWDFQNDTFMQGWVAYRTRKDRSLPLRSDTHTYPSPGSHRIVVKVVDIFGNDTSHVREVEVR